MPDALLIPKSLSGPFRRLNRRVNGGMLALAISSPFALGLCVAHAEQEPLQGSIIQSEQRQDPHVNYDDVKAIEKGVDLEMTVTTPLTSISATEGDEFFAKISRDYQVDGKTVIPRGTLCHGIVSQSKGPRWAGRNAYITTRFDYLITPDGREIPIEGQFSNKDKPLTAAAKIVGRSTAYTAVGGVVGAVMVLKYGGMAAVAASNGYALAGGAALGGAAGLTSAIVTKGHAAMIQPGADLKIKLQEPLKLPTVDMPDQAAKNFAPEGFTAKILAMRLGSDPFGEPNELTISVDLDNRTANTVSFFDIALEDENGTIFYASPFGDSGLWFQKLNPNSRLTGNLSFSVDNPKLQHFLVIYKQYTREPLARLALTDKMTASKKVARERLRKASEKPETAGAQQPD
ncbi:MAG: hypothetical protein IPK79_09620 [Vampirovibrionales bacterium]|nr:hypothetical protein [Vampirovibrionales bacterium]